MLVQNNSLSSNMNIIMINSTNKNLHIYQLSGLNFISKYTSELQVNDIGWGISNCAFFISSYSSGLYRIELTNFTVDRSIAYSG